MQLHDFLGQVQHRARLANIDDALRATRATLETLGERVYGGESENLGSQLPRELKEILSAPRMAEGESFGADEFFKRVSEREGEDLPAAVFHARAVVHVLRDAVSPGVVEKAKAQLPDDYGPLFESGSEGRMSAS